MTQEAPHCPPSSHIQHLLTLCPSLLPAPGSEGIHHFFLSTCWGVRPLTNGQPWSHAVSRCPRRPSTLRPSINSLSDCPRNTRIHFVCGGKGNAARPFCRVSLPCASHVVLTEGRGLLLSESQPLLDPSLPPYLSAAPARHTEGLRLLYLLFLLQASLLCHRITAVHSFVSLEQDADVFQNFLQPQAVSFLGKDSLEPGSFPSFCSA